MLKQRVSPSAPETPGAQKPSKHWLLSATEKQYEKVLEVLQAPRTKYTVLGRSILAAAIAFSHLPEAEQDRLYATLTPEENALADTISK